MSFLFISAAKNAVKMIYVNTVYEVEDKYPQSNDNGSLSPKETKDKV